jgi:cyanophycinase
MLPNPAVNRRHCAAWLAAALLLPMAAAVPAAPATPPGPVVVIGGALRDDNPAVWGRLVALAGGAGARFAVLATASSEPEASAASIVANLQRHGAHAQALPVAPRWPGVDAAAAANDARWAALVERSQGVFFSGGAQARLLDTLQPQGRPTLLLDSIHALLARGGVVAGTSSGAAVLSALAFRDAPDVLAVLQGRLREGTEFDRGFGFLRPDVVVDQHFIARGRIGRLLPLMALRAVPLGLGVEEDSAAVVQGDRVEALGARGVLVVDLAGATHDAALGAFNVRGARLWWLASGDGFDLRARTLQPAPSRRAGRTLDPADPGFVPTHRGPAHFNDMLGEGTLLNAMARLVDGDAAEVTGLSFDGAPRSGEAPGGPGFAWRLHRGADTRGWADGTAAGFTFADVRLHVQPLRMAQPLHAPWKP